MDTPVLLTLDDIRAAHERIRPHVHRTPLLTSAALDRLATARLCRPDERVRVRLALKAEHLQKVGAFKMRGATNATLRHLEQMRTAEPDFDVARLALVTHSSGNHAAALAAAAASVGAKAHVVMPSNAPEVKKAAVAGYGARIYLCEPTLVARQTTAERVMEEQRAAGAHAVFVHPYDEPWVIAGQGTLGIELHEQVAHLEQRAACSHAAEASAPAAAPGPLAWQHRGADEPQLDIVVAPVGGGGNISGVSTAVTGLDKRIEVHGAEPADADDAHRSMQHGSVQPAIVPARTICDGLLTSISERTLAHLQARVKQIHLVNDRETLAAMRLVYERMKQVIEPSAATPLAAVLSSDSFRDAVRPAIEAKARALAADEHAELRIALVITGGNVELGNLVRAMEQAEEAQP